MSTSGDPAEELVDPADGRLADALLWLGVDPAERRLVAALAARYRRLIP